MHHWHGRLWLRHWRSRGPAGPIQYLWFCCVCYYISSLADIVYQNFDACSCSCSCCFLSFSLLHVLLVLPVLGANSRVRYVLESTQRPWSNHLQLFFCVFSSYSVGKKSHFYVDNTHVYGFCSYFCSLSSPCCCCSRCCFELSRQFVKMIRRMFCPSKTLIPRQRLHVERCQKGLLIKDMTRLKIWL